MIVFKMFYKFFKYTCLVLLMASMWQGVFAMSGDYDGETATIPHASRMSLAWPEKKKEILGQCIQVLTARKAEVQSLLTELMAKSFSPENFFIKNSIRNTFENTF